MALSAPKIKPEGHNRNWAPPLRELHNSPSVQTKLEIGKPGDKYEQEADNMADQVMMAPYDRSKMAMMAPNSDNPTLRMMPVPKRDMVMMAGNPDNPTIRMKPLVQKNELPGNEEEQEKVQMQTQRSSDQVQLMENEEEEPMVQMMEQEEELVQTKPAIQKSEVGKTNASPNLSSRLNNTKGNGQPLPKDTRGHMEQGFGADFSNVKIHTDKESVQMNQEIGAKAFTHGSDVYFNQGQYAPNSNRGKKLLAHELTHTIQQGKSPKVQSKKIGPGSEALKLDNKLQMSKMNGEMIQMAPVDSLFGEFNDAIYTAKTNGVNMKLEFDPSDNVDATKIGLTQSVRSYLAGSNKIIHPTQEHRTVTGGGAGDGYRTDRLSARNNPIYGTNSLGAGKGLKDSATTGASNQLGHHYTDATGLKHQKAFINDGPNSPHAANNSGQVFETTALALDGTQAGTYYGSVSWGWKKDAAGTHSLLPFELVSMGVPSQNYMTPAAKWNTATSTGTIETRAAPTNVYKADRVTVDFTVPVNTTVTVRPGFTTNGTDVLRTVNIPGAPVRTGLIKVDDLKDLKDGGATVDLPIVTHSTKQTNMTEAQLKAEIKTLGATLTGLAAGHVNIPQITAELKVYKDFLGDVSYNRRRGYPVHEIKAIQAVVGSAPTGTFDSNTIIKIKKWQTANGLDGDGRFGSKSKKKFDAIVKAAVTANKAKGFTVDQIKKIQREVGSNDDGTWGPNTVKHLMTWQKGVVLLSPTGEFDLLTKFIMFPLGF